MDAIDRKILAVVQEDASLSVAEIGQRVGLSSTPCWKRLQRLEADGVITRRVAIIDPEKVGLGITVFVSIETGDHSQDWLKRFADVVGAMPEVMEFYRMAGDVDYMLRVVVPDIAGYDGFYKKLIATVPLKNVTSRFAMERIKSTTALPIAEARERSAWPGDLLQRHHLDDGRSKNDDKQHRQEKENHRYGELRRQPGRLFLGFRHAHVAVFLRHHTQHGGERRAVALGLL
jgi:Lrp/AsnC family transcriptional regulator